MLASLIGFQIERAVLSFLPDCRAAVSSTHCLPVPVPRPEPLPGAWSFAGSDRWAAHWSRVRTAHRGIHVYPVGYFFHFHSVVTGDIRFVLYISSSSFISTSTHCLHCKYMTFGLYNHDMNVTLIFRKKCAEYE